MDHLFALFIFSLTATITPGPNNIMIMTSGLNFGVKNSVPHWLGICLGFPAMVVLVGLGFSVLFEQFPIIHQVIKVFGVLYLLYLAVRIATAPVSSLNKSKAKPFTFLQAVIFQWVNPKAWVMATGAVSTYTTLGSDMAWQVIIIALTFLTVAFPSVGVWLIFGVGLQRLLQNSLHQKIFNGLMASLLILSILPIIKELFIEYF